MECSCTLAALRGHRTWKVYDWGGGGVGWGGIITSMHACATMWCYVDGMCLHAGSSTWSPHMESIWLGGWGVGWGGIITSMHACGTMWCYVDGMCLHAGSSTWSPHMESIWLGEWGGGVGWDNDVHARLRNYVMLRWWNVLARWQLYVVTAHGKYMIGGVEGVGWDNNVHVLEPSQKNLPQSNEEPHWPNNQC